MGDAMLNTLTGILKAVLIFAAGLAIIASVLAALLASPDYAIWLALVAVFAVLVIGEL